MQNGESSHVLRIFDDEAQAMQSARSSSRMLEEAYETGVTILHKYADQRDRLKVKKKVSLKNKRFLRPQSIYIAFDALSSAC